MVQLADGGKRNCSLVSQDNFLNESTNSASVKSAFALTQQRLAIFDCSTCMKLEQFSTREINGK